MNRIIIIILFFLILPNILHAKEHTEQTICDAIYIIEGKENARQPFGIETIECKTFMKCKKICLNTIKNNKIRYVKYGHKKYKTFIEFLASRYCPYNQKNWVKMLNYYLNKNKD